MSDGLDSRAARMLEMGVFRCPDWCTQPDDEEQYEEHFKEPVEIVTVDSVTVRIGLRMSWFDVDNLLIVITPPQLDAWGDFVFSAQDYRGFTEIVDGLITEAQYGQGVIWAYEGAEEDEAVRAAAQAQESG